MDEALDFSMKAKRPSLSAIVESLELRSPGKRNRMDSESASSNSPHPTSTSSPHAKTPPMGVGRGEENGRIPYRGLDPLPQLNGAALLSAAAAAAAASLHSPPASLAATLFATAGLFPSSPCVTSSAPFIPDPLLPTTGLALSTLNRRRRGQQGSGGSMHQKLSPASMVSSPTSSGNLKKAAEPVPDEKKDDAYWERRRKNNEAAKRSRDTRRQKEEEIAVRAALLEQENLKLRAQVALLKNETTKLHYMLLSQMQTPS